MLLCSQAEQNVTVTACVGAPPPLAAAPYLLRLPAAVALLPHATLAVTQTSSGSSATAHWWSSLSSDHLQLAAPLDVDLDSNATVAFPVEV